MEMKWHVYCQQCYAEMEPPRPEDLKATDIKMQKTWICKREDCKKSHVAITVEFF